MTVWARSKYSAHQSLNKCLHTFSMNVFQSGLVREWDPGGHTLHLYVKRVNECLWYFCLLLLSYNFWVVYFQQVWGSSEDIYVHGNKLLCPPRELERQSITAEQAEDKKVGELSLIKINKAETFFLSLTRRVQNITPKLEMLLMSYKNSVDLCSYSTCWGFIWTLLLRDNRPREPCLASSPFPRSGGQKPTS